MQLLLKRTHTSSDNENENNPKSRAEGQNVALGQGWVSTALFLAQYGNIFCFTGDILSCLWKTGQYKY
jgi:hypothetical protein